MNGKHLLSQPLTTIILTQLPFSQNKIQNIKTQPLLKQFKKTAKEPLNVFIFFCGLERMLEKLSIFEDVT
jgi:hypothetical protein